MIQCLFNVRWSSQHHADTVTGDEFYLVDRHQIRRVVHGHGQRRAKKFIGNKLMLLDDLRWNQAKNGVFNITGDQLHGFDAELLSEKFT